MTSATASGPAEVRELTANDPLRAEGPGGWLLTSGRAQVFAVRCAGADGPPTRHPLVQVGTGELVLALPAGAGFTLLAVGLEPGTAARPQSIAALRGRAAAGGAVAGEVRNLVETWLEELARAVAVPNPRQGVRLGVGAAPDSGQGRCALEAGQAAWPATRTVWVRATAGLRLFGVAPLGDGGPDTVVPLPANAWVTADTPVVLQTVPGGDALADDGGWRGVDAFMAAACRLLETRLRDDEDDARARLARRHTLDETVVHRSYGELAAILEARRGRPAAVAADDELLAAMQLVGDALGMTLVRPRRDTSAGTVAEVDAVARASGLRTRQVTLDEDWWRQDAGPLVGWLADNGKPVAILARRPGRYVLTDPLTGARTKVGREVAGRLQPVAVMVYRALPAGPLRPRDVWRFAARPIRGELWWWLLFGVLVGAVSLVTPLATDAVFSSVVPGLQQSNLVWLTALLAVFALSSFGFVVAQLFALSRIESQSSTELQAALWDRLLDLPLPFFRRYSAGELTQRVMAVEQVRRLAAMVAATTLVSIPIGLFNLGVAFVIQPVLALCGLAVLAVVVLALWLLMRYQIVRVTTVTEANRRSFGLALQLVDAVGKLRVAGAADRGFAQWAGRFAQAKRSFFDAQLGFVATTALTMSVIGLTTLAVLLGAAAMGEGAVDGATFIAFNTALTQAVLAVSGLSAIALFVVRAVPLLRSVEPVLTQTPETYRAQTDPGELTGRIDVSHVVLRYSPDGPAVLDDLTFSITPGQFVALVGPSGAGKSTVLRLLLGFEQPEVGTVRYDGKDLDTLDVRALRNQLGVVTQSVRLLPGSILENIVGNRRLGIDDAWEAAEVAGIADDIRAMPMGMQTFVSEGGSTFSGGQRQRLLIARAVVAKPRILFFDEATSALDNRTQAHVADAIARLRATRLVIAHRLSTIRGADRILVLVRGRVVQDGGYDALVAEAGPFRQMAARQLA